ncbi:MAG TPA: hypothetical protein VL485_08215 [Ktedonobacteraceae bacterium]|nr:hypothetical protein [Ktedonobacteraceae bacterium]
MTYTRVTRWLLPLFVLLVLATLMLFAQLSMHSHAAAPKNTKHTVTTTVTPTTTPVAGGGMTPDASWRG